GRDGCRTPMQWSKGAEAGFSTAEPWLPLSLSHGARNVATLREDPTSIYNLYRNLLALRRRRTSLQVGDYRPIVTTGEVLMYVRQHPKERLLVALNMSAKPVQTAISGQISGRLLLSSIGDRQGEAVSEAFDLRANEGAIIELSPDSMLTG